MTSRFRNLKTGVVVSVADAKAERFADGRWEVPGSTARPKAKAKPKPAPEKPDKK